MKTNLKLLALFSLLLSASTFAGEHQGVASGGGGGDGDAAPSIIFTESDGVALLKCPGLAERTVEGIHEREFLRLNKEAADQVLATACSN